MADKIELCDDCIHNKAYEQDPQAFEEALGRFAASGFTCDGLDRELAPGSSPFDVPTPRMVKKCGLDKALELALNAEGYEDTPTENTGRQLFFNGELDLSPVTTQ